MASRMKDVAERARVSVTTVSHLLNNTRYVAPETRQRILDAIRELGFYKNEHARRLVRGYSNFYGMIVSNIENPFFSEIVARFESALQEDGADLFLCNTNYDPARSDAALRKMLENKVRGVAIMTSEWPGGLTRELIDHQVATVFLDIGPVGPYTSNIRVDYASGIYEAIDYLVQLGHRHFAFIAGPRSLTSAVIRREAFLEALRHNHITQCEVLEGNHKVDGATAAVQSLLTKPNSATAILCSNDLTAIGALSTLHEAGLKIPQDISVVGFDDIAFASLAYPPLTTISLPRSDLAKLAFEALQQIHSSERGQGSEYVIQTHLVVRGSTGQAPSLEGQADFNALCKMVEQGK